MAYNDGSDPTLAELITAAFVPQVYSKKSLMHTKSRLVAKEVFNTTYEADLVKGHTVYIPVYSEGSTTEVSPGTEAVASDLASASPKSITVDQWRYEAVEISNLIKKEQHADYLNGAVESASYGISKYIDTTVGALFSTLGGSSYPNADGTGFTDEIFRSLVESLDENDVPEDDRALLGDSSTKRDMLDIEKFISVDYNKTPVVPTGKFGELYGVKVHITNNLTAASTGNYGVLAHRDAIGLVVQLNPNVNVYPMGYKFIAAKVVVDAAWGKAELRDTFGKAFYTRKS